MWMDYPNLDQILGRTCPSMLWSVTWDTFDRIDVRMTKDFRRCCVSCRAVRVWAKADGAPIVYLTEALPYSKCRLVSLKLLVQEAPETCNLGVGIGRTSWSRGDMPNDGDLLDLLLRLGPGCTAIRHRILVDNATESVQTSDKDDECCNRDSVALLVPGANAVHA